MAIPRYDYMLPQPDDLMDYDYVLHQYIPKIEAILTNTYVDLLTVWGSEENAQSYLDLLRKVVYDVIMSMRDGVKYQNQVLYYLSHSKEARRQIWELFSDTTWYNFRDGGFMMAYNTGANLNLGKEIMFSIEKALSPIARQKISNSELGARILKYNINEFTYFDTLEELVSYLETNSFITSDEADLVALITDIPTSYKYKVFINRDGKYTFEDLLSYNKIIAQMKIYNNVSGNW